MRAGVHRELCESNAVCVALAPDVFDLDENGLVTAIDDDLEDDQAESVRLAIPSCPRAAVFLREAGSTGVDDA
ncbi:ferredoxin [Nocardia miyunensis]|uniref:ferredoxin n=1 Tax=Nocardia miyunensis TaxID=282684 RepID=UPI00082F353C|nr:ferredoxin [Nocardia miyunensis]